MMPMVSGHAKLAHDVSQREKTKMEFGCPECSKRLRIPNDRVNPKVRCTNCGHIFRLVSEKRSQDCHDDHKLAGREQLLRWILENERKRRLKNNCSALAVALMVERRC